ASKSPLPRATADAVAITSSMLSDPVVRAYLQVHDWDGVEWLAGERWVRLVQLAEALDRASGAKRSSPAIVRLLPAAEAAGDRVDRIVPSLRIGSPRTSRSSTRTNDP